MEPAKIALASGNGHSASHLVDPVDVRRQQYQTPGTATTLLLHGASASTTLGDILCNLSQLVHGRPATKRFSCTIKPKKLYILFCRRHTKEIKGKLLRGFLTGYIVYLNPV